MINFIEDQIIIVVLSGIKRFWTVSPSGLMDAMSGLIMAER